MTFPDGLALITVTSKLNAANGQVEFIARQPLIGSADNSIVVPFTVIADINDSGVFTASLPATNDPGWTPQGWAYAVRITAGGTSFRGTLQLDYQATSVDLADLLQVDGTASAGASYILLGQRGVAGGVAALDADGDVTDASGAKITGGGGGGGPSPSSTVVAETSYGSSSSAGNATTYSRGNHTHGTPAAPTSTDISDATTTGKALLTAASSAAARTAIGAETSGAAASALVTAESYTDSSIAAHAADTTSVHGITDTSALVVTTDTRLSNARTPTAHASTHASGGTDEVAIAASQVTSGTLALARLPTGTSSSTVALGDAPASAVSTHVAAANPHTQYRRTYVESAGTYAVMTSARDFVGPDDPAGKGFTLADGDKWYQT